MAKKQSRHHALERTSPRGLGQPFIGRCIQCGRTGLPSSAVHEWCDNLRGLSEDDALFEAIDGAESSHA